MKKLILGLVLCLCMTVSVVAQSGIPITVDNYSFELPAPVGQLLGWNGENGADIPGWSSDSECRSSGIADSAQFPGTVGAYAGELGCDGWPDSTMPEPGAWNLTDYTIAAGEVYILKVEASNTWTQDGYNPKLTMTLYCNNAGTRIPVKSFEHVMPNADWPSWDEYSIVFDVDKDDPTLLSVGKKIGIELENTEVNPDGYSWMVIDNVRLEQLLAYSPDPCDEELDVAVGTNLTWTLDASVTNCDVYFGSDPNFINNPKVVDGETEGKVELYDPPAPLANGTTYYWRVDARVGTTVYEGGILEFTTIVAEPVIMEDPCGLTVNAGETAVFRVKATNATGYSWQKLGGGEVGTDSTLTIANVQKANEGVYWCEVSNAADTVESAKVNLMTKRLVARWEFEDNLNDAETGDWPGVYTDPNTANDPPAAVYVLDPCSIDDGKALQLSDDALHVRITDSEDFFNFYPQGYTINTWIKSGQSDYGCMASKQDRTGYPNAEGWVLDCGEGVAHHALLQVGYAGGTAEITDNEWHMVTGTYDAETGVVAVYVDGKLDAESEPGSDVAPTNSYPLAFGVEVIDGFEPYVGLLDKVSIYSYSLDSVDVAVLYVDVMGGTICLERPEYDLNDDCKVDILDFAEFAADWLECNIVPTCLP